MSEKIKIHPHLSIIIDAEFYSKAGGYPMSSSPHLRKREVANVWRGKDQCLLVGYISLN